MWNKIFLVTYSRIWIILLLTNFSVAEGEICSDKEQILSVLNEAVKSKTQSEEFSGTILIGFNEDILFKEAYGVASRRFNVPNRITTRFNLGSINKIFTTIAIAQLVEQGRLDYGDTIDKYLDSSWVKPEISGRITISHLLTHTSGLGDFFNNVFWNTPRSFYKSVDDFKDLKVGEELKFEPGENWSYSNFGFILLGAVIEKITGEKYSEYVSRNIYKPSGMNGTGEFDMELPVTDLAIGYQKMKTENGEFQWENNLFKHLIKGGPGGGGFSTVDDLFKFSHALRHNTLLKAETLELLWTEKSGTGDEKNKWGYGFIVRRDPKLGKIIGHSGGFFGISTSLWMYVDSGFTVAILSNYGDGGEAISNDVRSSLIGLKSLLEK